MTIVRATGGPRRRRTTTSSALTDPTPRLPRVPSVGRRAKRSEHKFAERPALELTTRQQAATDVLAAGPARAADIAQALDIGASSARGVLASLSLRGLANNHDGLWTLVQATEVPR